MGRRIRALISRLFLDHLKSGTAADETVDARVCVSGSDDKPARTRMNRVVLAERYSKPLIARRAAARTEEVKLKIIASSQEALRFPLDREVRVTDQPLVLCYPPGLVASHAARNSKTMAGRGSPQVILLIGANARS